MLVYELQPLLTRKRQLAIVSKATNSLKLSKTDELINVILKNATIVATFLDREPKPHLSVLFHNQCADIGLLIFEFGLKGFLPFLLVIFGRSRIQAVNSFDFVPGLLMRVLDSHLFPTDERLVHLILVAQMRQRM